VNVFSRQCRHRVVAVRLAGNDKQRPLCILRSALSTSFASYVTRGLRRALDNVAHGAAHRAASSDKLSSSHRISGNARSVIEPSWRRGHGLGDMSASYVFFVIGTQSCRSYGTSAGARRKRASAAYRMLVSRQNMASSADIVCLARHAHFLSNMSQRLVMYNIGIVLSGAVAHAAWRGH